VRVHLPKRTIIPQNKNVEGEAANGEVKTYYLSKEELDYYENLPKPDDIGKRVIHPNKHKITYMTK
jgi:hypothetical protein